MKPQFRPAPAFASLGLPALLLTLALSLSAHAAGHTVNPDPDRGLYAIWVKGDALAALPFIKGSQIVCQWRDLEPTAGVFDFAPLAEQLAALARQGRKATVQVNGNLKPDWLFAKVPYHPERFDVQVRDPQGVLMYWHPTFVRAYLDFLAAYGAFLRQSPHKSAVLGVRLNFNPLGTEHHAVPPGKRALAQWITPPGAAPGTPFTPHAAEDYDDQVVAAFVKHFSDFTRVFVRNNVSEEIRAKYAAMFATGRLAWFHTSSEMEPRGANGGEKQYLTFLNDCRPGKTVGYAEPWADAWGLHGGQPDGRWCSPPQFNYWRLLSDLNMGISFIALYGNDLEVAASGRHQRQAVPEYREEFTRAFEFAARYAGYHASPAVAPGAWVAFRHSTINRMTKANLEKVTGDYNFLMERLPGPGTIQANAGPAAQRFGAWALRLAPGERASLKLNEAFLQSLKGGVTLRVIYLDEGKGIFTLQAGGQALSTTLTDSKKWRTAEFKTSAAALVKDAAGAHLTLTPQGVPIAFHMVEVIR